MTDINDLLAPSAERKSSAGGFTGFVIATFEGMQGLIFVSIWIFVAAPFVLGGMFLGDNMSDPEVAVLGGLVAGAIIGFLFAVAVTGFAEVFIDMRRQLVAIRKRLEERN